MKLPAFLMLVLVILVSIVGAWIVWTYPCCSDAIQAIGAIGTFLGILFLVYQTYEQRRVIAGESLSVLFTTLFNSASRDKRRYILEKFHDDFLLEAEKAYKNLLIQHAELSDFKDWKSFRQIPSNRLQILRKNLDLRKTLVEPVVKALDVPANTGLPFTKLGAVEDTLSDLEMITVLTRITKTQAELDDFHSPVIRDIWKHTADFVEFHVLYRPSENYKINLRKYINQLSDENQKVKITK